MSEVQDSWKEVAAKAEALGLKLKLHLEQELDENSERTPGDTKAVIEDIGQKISDAFDSVGNAAKDPAVHSDVKDIGSMMKDAFMTTFSAVGAEVSARTPRSSDAGDTPQDGPPPPSVEDDDEPGDEAGD